MDLIADQEIVESRAAAIREYALRHAMSAADIDDVWHTGIASIAARRPQPDWLLRAKVETAQTEAAGA